MHRNQKQTLSMRIAAIVVAMACAATAAAQTAPQAQTKDVPTAAQPAAAAGSASAPAAPEAAAPASAPANAAAPATPEAAAVERLLKEKFPQAQIRNVGKTTYFGLYEAQFDEQLVYTDPQVNYVVVGQIFDANSKQNLTEARNRKLNRIAWDSLPLDLAMKKVKGNGSRKLVVFSDADCPFCARLEKELQTVDNVTIYTFLFPIDSLHPDAARKSKVIWCSPDRVKAWDEFFTSGKLPNNSGDCETPLPQTLALGRQLHFNATPTLIFADGSVVPGALPKERLEAELTQADAEAKKLAAAKK